MIGLEVRYSSHSDSFHLYSLYTTFGPLNFDDPQLLDMHQMDLLTNVWFRNFLSADEQAHLPRLLVIAATGSDNYYALDIAIQQCYLCSHDPAGIFSWLPSFDTFIQCAVINLSWSGYGWPDPAVEQMARELIQELFGV